MIPVYLCEDDISQLTTLKNLIEKYIFIEGYDMKVVCAARSASALLEALPSSPETAAYFLDIQLNCEMDGIELAAGIRKTDPRAFIIFTTTHSEMAVTTFHYQVEPLDFLIKDDPSYAMYVLHCLQNIVEKSRVPAVSLTGRLHFRLPDQDLFLPVNEILYIQSTAAHKITIHTLNGIYQCPGAPKETKEKLNDTFFLCHKSCLVNIEHIRKLLKNPLRIELDNGTVCPCAQRRYWNLQKLMEAL